MRKLSLLEIEKLASRKNVRRIAVENFLMSAQECGNLSNATLNLYRDAQAYRWNAATVNAIRIGLERMDR